MILITVFFQIIISMVTIIWWRGQWIPGSASIKYPVTQAFLCMISTGIHLFWWQKKILPPLPTWTHKNRPFQQKLYYDLKMKIIKMLVIGSDAQNQSEQQIIFARVLFSDVKFCENKTLMKWQNYSAKSFELTIVKTKVSLLLQWPLFFVVKICE